MTAECSVQVKLNVRQPSMFVLWVAAVKCDLLAALEEESGH